MPNIPAKKIGTSIVRSIGVDGKVVIQNLNPLEILREYLDYRKTVEEQETERERIAAKRDVAVAVIESEKEVIFEYFKLRFSERKDALRELFNVLHAAVGQKNEKAMDTALTGILGVLKDNPLKDFESFRQARASDRFIEI